VTALTPATLAEWEREARAWLDPEADVGRDPMQAINDMAWRVLALVSNPFTIQAAETIDSLREQLAGWQHVAAYYLGDFADSHDPDACRREAVRRATESRDPVFEAICDRLAVAESALATARREAQEARHELEGLAQQAESLADTHAAAGIVIPGDFRSLAISARRALASPEAHDETRPDRKESEG
jgi:hypothetical protein